MTIAVMISGRGETKHRGKTLTQALKVAEKVRLPSGCKFHWHNIRKGRKVYKLPGRVPGLDGEVRCNGRRTGDDVFALVYRPRGKYTGSGKVSGRVR